MSEVVKKPIQDVLPVFFASAFIICLEARNRLILKPGKLRSGVTFMGALLLTYHLLHPITPLINYTIFKKHTDVKESNVFGYAGDYWQVWPNVMYDIAKNKESFGFGYRGNGNALKLNSAAMSLLDNGVNLTVVCLQSSVEKCISQVENAIEERPLTNTTNIGANDTHILSFTAIDEFSRKKSK